MATSIKQADKKKKETLEYLTFNLFILNDLAIAEKTLECIEKMEEVAKTARAMFPKFEQSKIDFDGK